MKTIKRGQPKKTIKRSAIRLTILPDIRRRADGVAFAQNKSLSRFIEDLLLREIEVAKKGA